MFIFQCWEGPLLSKSRGTLTGVFINVHKHPYGTILKIIGLLVNLGKGILNTAMEDSLETKGFEVTGVLVLEINCFVVLMLSDANTRLHRSLKKGKEDGREGRNAERKKKKQINRGNYLSLTLKTY